MREKEGKLGRLKIFCFDE
jgi:hypothetical protein